MKFEETVLRSWPTGSRYICYPPVTNTDNDTVILVNGFHDWQKMLMDDGWEVCGDYEFGGEFSAFRKGEENYIITENPDFFNRYVFATEGAKALNLMNKDDRIKLFRAIGDSGEGYVGLRVDQDKKPRDEVAPLEHQVFDIEQAPPVVNHGFLGDNFGRFVAQRHVPGFGIQDRAFIGHRWVEDNNLRAAQVVYVENHDPRAEPF